MVAEIAAPLIRSSSAGDDGVRREREARGRRARAGRAWRPSQCAEPHLCARPAGAPRCYCGAGCAEASSAANARVAENIAHYRTLRARSPRRNIITMTTDIAISHPRADDALRRGERVPRCRGGVRRGGGSAARAGDGARRTIDPDADSRVLRARPDGHRGRPSSTAAPAGSLIMVTLAVEEISKVDASAAIMVDVQNTLVNYPIARYGTEAQKRSICRASRRDTVGAYALSEAGSGSDAFGLADPRREARRQVDPQRAKALDHQRRRSRDLRRVRERESRRPATRASRRSSSSATSRDSPSARRRTSSASARRARRSCCSTAARCPAENVLGPVGQGYKIAIETLNEGRIGIGAQMIGVAQGALDARSRT